MQPDRWGRLNEIFARATQLDAGGRAAYLDQACATDPTLRRELDRMLREHVDTETFHIFEEPKRNSLSLGESIAGRFRIVRFVGHGGMGEVYEAEDLELGGSVALKVIRPELLDDPQFISRFRREVHLARQVTHPNVCRIFDFGYDRSGDVARAFLTMEFIDGEPLGKTLRRGGRLSTEAALPLVKQIAAGLEALHQKGIVHRDVKPGNILIMRSDSGSRRAVIGDFGLAREHLGDDSVHSLSRSGHVIGTPDYMAPEQLMGKPVTSAADIYALGLVMYEMVTGMKAFTGGRAIENAVQRLTDPPPPPRTHVPDLDPEWEAVILRCLEKEPGDRPARAVDVAAALAGDTPLPKPASSAAGRPSSRNWVGWAVGVAVMVALSISVWRFPGWLAWKQGTVESQHLAVLPFKVLGGEADLRVFADGLMETITSRLSQYEHGDSPLLVVPASEVRQQSAKSAGDAAKRFGVTAAVEGSVQSQGSRVRLLLTLIDTKQQRQTETIIVEDERANALSLQDAAVSRLANAMSVRVQPQHTSDAPQFTAVAPGAYEFYVHARGYLQRTDKLDSVENAITVARRALEIDPKYAAAHAALGEAYWYKFQLTREQEWIEQALASCRRSLELNGNLQEAHVTMGQIHVGTGRFSEAQQDFEKALAANGRSHEAYQGLADVYFRLNQFDKAEATYAKAISMRPGDWSGYRRMGFFYFRRGEFDKAAEQYEKVVALTPDNALGYVNLGTIHFRKERFADAKKMWLKALELDPDRFTTIMNLAKLHYEMGEYKAAIQLYERAVKVNERDYLSWGNLGIAYKHENQPAKAASALATAIKLTESELLVNPKRADLYSFTAYYHAMAGTLKNVDGLARRALALGGDDNDIVIRIAGAYALMGRNDAAADLVKKAVARGYPAKSLLRHVPLRGVVARLGIAETTSKE